MKKITKIFLLACLFTSSLATQAQTPKKRFTSDIYAGLNLAKIENKDNQYSDPKLGLRIGINLNYKILGNVQLQTGFLVTKKGLKTKTETRTETPGGSWEIKEEWRSVTGNYIQVPLNLGYEVFFTNKLAFNINAGVYGAYGYKGKGTGRTITTSATGNENPVMTQEGPTEFESFTPTVWRRLDYGFNGSVGFVYDIYTLNFNYEHGLYNIVDVANVNNIGIINKNRVYSVSLGFRF